MFWDVKTYSFKQLIVICSLYNLFTRFIELYYSTSLQIFNLIIWPEIMKLSSITICSDGEKFIADIANSNEILANGIGPPSKLNKKSLDLNQSSFGTFWFHILLTLIHLLVIIIINNFTCMRLCSTFFLQRCVEIINDSPMYVVYCVIKFSNNSMEYNIFFKFHS